MVKPRRAKKPVILSDRILEKASLLRRQADLAVSVAKREQLLEQAQAVELLKPAKEPQH